MPEAPHSYQSQIDCLTDLLHQMEKRPAQDMLGNPVIRWNISNCLASARGGAVDPGMEQCGALDDVLGKRLRKEMTPAEEHAEVVAMLTETKARLEQMGKKD